MTKADWYETELDKIEIVMRMDCYPCFGELSSNILLIFPSPPYLRAIQFRIRYNIHQQVISQQSPLNDNKFGNLHVMPLHRSEFSFVVSDTRI